MNISLIIATYNRGSAIAPTLTSALQQSVPVDELIVVDDGSTDDTANWVRENFPSIKLITKKNGGTSSARNAGARSAGGDWLMFLDHDDLLLPSAVECLVGLSQQYLEAASLHADHIYDNVASGVRHENHHYTLPAFRRLLDTEAVNQMSNSRLYGYPLYRSLLRGNLLQQPYMVRRSVFEAIGGYSEDVRYCEDWDLYLRIAQQYQVAVADDVISRHVIEGENLHLTAAEKQELMYERVLRRRWRSHRWLQVTENRIARQKLAAIYKTQGDRAWREGTGSVAWRKYLGSALNWPFDHVVLARLLWWAVPAIGDLRRADVESV